MAASYPTSVKSFTTKLSADVIQAAHPNEIQDEVVALENDLVNGIARLRVGTNSATIASGAFTATKSQYAVDTEAAAASDDLDTITAGSGIGAGALLILTAANVARVVTVKDSTGNIELNGGAFALDSVKKALFLYYDGTNWVEVARSAAAASSAIVTLVDEGSGTDTNAAAATVDTMALSGLTVKDSLRVIVTADVITQQVADVVLHHVTDNVTVLNLAGGALAAARGIVADVIITCAQDANTHVIASGNINKFNPAGNNNGANAPSLATAYTGSWSLGLRHTGVTAGGTFRYRWAVYKLAGQ